MSEYIPDYWKILKITPVDSNEIHYRVFGTWNGSYLDGDSWRLNSGITKIIDADTHYEFYGSSGSVYKCGKNRYGSNSYGSQILKRLIEESAPIAAVDELNEGTDFMSLEYR